ncbi:MAG: SurA N-terminal domain-containing protein [Croceibacterium sp.]
MLQLFRSFFKSKFGIGITLAFLVVIAIAFASSDVANNALNGGIAGGDRVAVVGSERIDAAELKTGMTNALDQMRQEQPTLTMPVFIAQGGINQVLDRILQRSALSVYARTHGMRAGSRLIDSEISQIPAFRGASGNFDENAYRALLSQRGLTDAEVRQDLANGLLARQLITPISFAPVMPESAGRRYASLLRERRQGLIAALPSAAYAPQGNPSDAQLQAFYRTANSRFIRPERRVIRFATFGEEAIGTRPPPTEAQIAQRFQRDSAQYTAIENRRLTQLVAPTQDAAKAILTEVGTGKSLDVVAREKGLATTTIGPITQAALTTSASAAVAQAAFAAPQGTMVQPTRGGLGWYILRVDAIEKQPARTLAQVRGDITAALTEEQRRQALADLTAGIEDRFDKGSSLADVAKSLKVDITSTKPATADGRIYAAQGEVVPPVLGRVIETAFDMREGEPQLAELVPGKTFIVYDVTNITPSAAAPLAEIRSDVVDAWRRDAGNKAAKLAADRVIGRLQQGSTLAAALAAEHKTVPAPQPVSINREELAGMQQVPPTLALMFSMARGTVKKLEGPNEGGWFIIQLNQIEPGKVEAGDPLIATTMRQLGTVTGQEYVEQFVGAVQHEIGVERNETAIKAVSDQLTGQGN